MSEEMTATAESIAADLAEQLRKIDALHEDLAAPLRGHRSRAEAAANSYRFGLGEVGDTDVLGLRRDLHALNELTAVQTVTIVGLQAAVQRQQVQITAMMRLFALSQQGAAEATESTGDVLEAIIERLQTRDDDDPSEAWRRGVPG